MDEPPVDAEMSSPAKSVSDGNLSPTNSASDVTHSTKARKGRRMSQRERVKTMLDTAMIGFEQNNILELHKSTEQNKLLGYPSQNMFFQIISRPS